MTMNETAEVGFLDRRPDLRLKCELRFPDSSWEFGSPVLNGIDGLPEDCLDGRDGRDGKDGREKKSSFLITRVVSRSSGLDDSDSVDRTGLDDPSSDLADDGSSLANVLADNDSDDTVYRSTEDVTDRPPQPHVGPRDQRDVHSRFRLVKIDAHDGVRSGRWHCLDFGDVEESRPASNPRNLAEAADNGNDNDPGAQIVCDLPASGSSHAAHGSRVASPADEISRSPVGAAFSVPTDFLSFGSNFLSNSDFTSRFQFVQENFLACRMRKPSESNEAQLGEGGASAVAIDNKIEQAMDLVKSHLMFAVREEVEQLKLKIQELADRNNQLEYENMVLRESAPHETLAKLQNAPSALPS